MKITLNWLRQYVDFDGSPVELAERLTMLGLEVEGVQKVAGDFDGVVVGQVLTREKVAGSDKLSVNRVADGRGERTIICGAQNHQPGDKVAVILPGFALPLKPGEKEPFVIQERKVFGVVSQGMMCSNKELGLGEDADGIIILPAEANVGQTFAAHLGRTGGDVIFDLEITPNRPDWNSVIGIAREISAVTGNPLKLPEIKLPDAAGHVDEIVAVRVEDAELCPRYTARVIRGVKVGPSPDWLRAALEKVGLRSINNVVDVTNFVMLESGQPLHAFDFHLIAKAASGKPTIVVRPAQEGERFTTLDKQERVLTAQNLLIADAGKGIALAGVMGGANTGIADDTRDVLIESAYFSSVNIRRTSKSLGLRSDSAYRFERGADIGICDWASRRAAQLILETAGGQLVGGVVDTCPQPPEPKALSVRQEKVQQLLGIEISRSEIERMLGSLGLMVARVPQPLDGTMADAPPISVRVPSFRVDLKRDVDLIEEVARLFGVDKIPSTPPRGAIGMNAYDSVHDQLAEARRILAGLGLNEAQGQTLIDDAKAKLAVIPAAIVPLANPLSSDMNVLRPSLLPGLLDSLQHNLSRKSGDVALFEVGRVFTLVNGHSKEERRIAIALTGRRAATFWCGAERDAKFNVSDLKGMLEEFLEQFGLRGVVYSRRAESTPLFLESATVSLGGKLPLGELGQLLPVLVKKYDLRDAVFLAELNLDTLLARRNPARSFKPLPQFPAIGRDVAMLVPDATTHETVLAAVKQARPANLEGAELFDIFRGKGVPDGQKSMAYAFTYRAADRTLTDAEVNTAHEKVIEQLEKEVGATMRAG